MDPPRQFDQSQHGGRPSDWDMARCCSAAGQRSSDEPGLWRQLSPRPVRRPRDQKPCRRRGECQTGVNIVNRDSLNERTFTPALHGFLDTIREGKPDIPILLISPIYCPALEDHPGPLRYDEKMQFVRIEGGHPSCVGSA